MISELKMEDSKLYMVDSEGNEHEISPKVDVDISDYMKWLEPTSYEPYEPIDDSGITITCEGLRSSGKAFNEAMRHTWDEIDAMRYCVEDIKNTNKYLEKKEGKDMKLLNMYVEKSEENIRKYYRNLIELEQSNDVVQKEYDKVVEGYKKAMKELAEKYNEVNSPTGSFIIIEPAFGMESRFTVVHKTTEKEEMYMDLCNEEFKQLHDKIDEVQAQLEIITSDENSSHHDINYVLHNYGIIDENYKLTPYTPTFVDEEAPVKEAPKKVGRPKKVSK